MKKTLRICSIICILIFLNINISFAGVIYLNNQSNVIANTVQVNSSEDIEDDEEFEDIGDIYEDEEYEDIEDFEEFEEYEDEDVEEYDEDVEFIDSDDLEEEDDDDDFYKEGDDEEAEEPELVLNENKNTYNVSNSAPQTTDTTANEVKLAEEEVVDTSDLPKTGNNKSSVIIFIISLILLGIAVYTFMEFNKYIGLP